MPRRTLRNTTALALGLSIALPHFSIAQPAAEQTPPALAEEAPVVVPPAAATTEAQAEEAPAQPEAAPVAEPAAADAAPEPSAEAAPAAEVAPQPVAVPEAAEEPAMDAAAEAGASGAAETAVVSEPATAPPAEAAPESEAAPEVEAAPDPVPAAEVAPEPEAAPEAEAAAKAEAAPEPAVASDSEGQPAPAELPTIAPEPAPAAEEIAGEGEKSSAVPAAEAPARPAVAQEPAKRDAPAVAQPDTADAVPPRAPEIPAPADMPSEADIARALGGEDKPADAAPAPAPAPADAAATGDAPVVGGAVIPGAPAADATAAPAPVQGAAATGADKAPGEAELAGARAVPEAEARPTEGAREAAAADTAPAAAALAETSAPVATSDVREVTDETARSATEDFVTDLKGTPRQGDIPVVGGETRQGASAPVVVGAEGQATAVEATQEAGEDDDRSDLENVLRQAVLPALAGLAVGQLLSNNRQVELNTGDRVVVTRPDGSQEIIKDDNALLLRPGSTVQNEEYADGSTRTIVTREDGSQVVTIRDADLRVLRRTLVRPDGTTTALIDETAAVTPVDVASLPPPARPVVVAPGEQLSEDALREALRRETQVDRTFTLGQIRSIPEVRALVAPVDIQAITFDTGSAAIKADQAQALSTLGRVIADSVRQNPAEIYLIEGHTDTVGADAMNLALSDRRAESVALALTEFFGVPPENMVVQGYGEQFLRVAQEGDVRLNRRAAVRRITDLLARN